MLRTRDWSRTATSSAKIIKLSWLPRDRHRILRSKLKQNIAWHVMFLYSETLTACTEIYLFAIRLQGENVLFVWAHVTKFYTRCKLGWFRERWTIKRLLFRFLYSFCRPTACIHVFIFAFPCMFSLFCVSCVIAITFFCVCVLFCVLSKLIPSCNSFVC